MPGTVICEHSKYSTTAAAFVLNFAQQANETGILVSWQPVSLGYHIKKHELLSN